MNSIIYMSYNIYILIICYLSESATYTDMNTLGYEILSSFKIIANKNNKKINVVDIISSVSSTKCLDGLKKMAKYLNEPANKGIVYHYDHRDDHRDDYRNDHWDEKRTSIDISNIFNNIDRKSALYIFNDSRSDGLTLDKKINNQNWTIIGGEYDHPHNNDGDLTMWGIFPALEALYNPTPADLHAFINSNILIGVTIEWGNSAVLNKKIF